MHWKWCHLIFNEDLACGGPHHRQSAGKHCVIMLGFFFYLPTPWIVFMFLGRLFHIRGIFFLAYKCIKFGGCIVSWATAKKKVCPQPRQKMVKTSGHSLPNNFHYHTHFDLDHPVLHPKPINTLKMTKIQVRYLCETMMWCLLLIFQSHTKLNQPAAGSRFIFTVKTYQFGDHDDFMVSIFS